MDNGRKREEEDGLSRRQNHEIAGRMSREVLMGNKSLASAQPLIAPSEERVCELKSELKRRVSILPCLIQSFEMRRDRLSFKPTSKHGNHSVFNEMLDAHSNSIE